MNGVTSEIDEYVGLQMSRWQARLISAAVCLAVLTHQSILWAGPREDGLAAYDKGDFPTALRKWLPLAKKGDAVAQTNIGVMYENGQGVPQNSKQAAAWYRKAAAKNNAIAQYNLGLMYRNGKGVPQDAREAVVWYRKAAEQNIATAQTNLGVMYHKGQGVPRDDKEAVSWFRKAADQGDAVAQANLGVMYENGNGVDKDAAEALRLYRLSTAQKDAPPKAKEALEKLEAALRENRKAEPE